jgi:hypothetical protein
MPSRPAFSFAGNATARSYDTLQQMTVGLLRDRTRTFTAAAADPVDAAGAHDTPNSDTTNLWVPETVHAALDLPLRRQWVTGMIRRWRYS